MFAAFLCVKMYVCVCIFNSSAMLPSINKTHKKEIKICVSVCLKEKKKEMAIEYEKRKRPFVSECVSCKCCDETCLRVKRVSGKKTCTLEHLPYTQLQRAIKAKIVESKKLQIERMSRITKCKHSAMALGIVMVLLLLLLLLLLSLGCHSSLK